MKSMRGKRSESFWPSIIVKKWLNIKPKVHYFSEDEAEAASGDDDDKNTLMEPFLVKVGREGMLPTEYSGAETKIPSSSRLGRRKSETLRVQYISKKDVRVMIGTWNVAGKEPFEELELDEWLRTREPADMYILGFQEVVPLNARNVLGAEDGKPIAKWEEITRRTLNKSVEQNTISKCYSVSSSSVFRTSSLVDALLDETDLPENHSIKRGNHNGSYKLDWPEYSLDTPQNAFTSGTKSRRVVNSSTNIGFGWLEGSQICDYQDLALKAGSKRVYHSSGNLKMLWPEQEEPYEALNTLDASEESFVENSSSYNSMKKFEAEERGECRKTRDRYVRIVSKQMVGIFVSVWVCRELRPHINNLEVSPVGVGLMGYLGNKGSVSVSMSLFQTKLCFVCSHLTSGHNEGDQLKRNSNVYDIIERTRFSSILDFNQPHTIPSHDCIFWFGDLNYRISMSDAEVRELVEMKQWEELLKYDQLSNEIKGGHIFYGWKEGLIDFAPTYKYGMKSNRYVGQNAREGEKKRTPAWCDRILWLGKGIEQLSYWRSELDLSDHRPVSSTFLVQVEVFNRKKLQRALHFTNPDVLPENLCYEVTG